MLSARRRLHQLATRPSRRSFSTATTGNLRLEKKDGVGIFIFDQTNSKVNVLSKEVINEFREAWNEFQKDPSLKSGVLISAKPGCFIAGADINMIAGCDSVESAAALARSGQLLMHEIATSERPIVAAIHGTCLGGGLELALACHYRVATSSPKTSLGLPEVQLGLLPGSGGTQRLPRLVALPEALDMMLTGKTVRADKAKKLKLVDATVDAIGPGLRSPEDNTLHVLQQVAIDTARQLAEKKINLKKLRAPAAWTTVKGFTQRLMQTAPVQSLIFWQAGRTVQAKTGGHYPAPPTILDVVQKGLKLGIDKGLEIEAQKFGELTQTNESKALISIFFGSTQLKKNRFGNPTRQPKNVAVLGAGLMGAGIAQVSIQKGGYNVVMKDTNANGLARGEQQILKNFTGDVKKKKMTAFDRDTLMGKVKSTLQYGDEFKSTDVVIEAVFEDLNIKHKVLRECEAVLPESAIFASNTSALPIGDIAKASKRPQQVIGMHYFSPVEKMPLLEIIKTPQTSNETCAIAVDVGLKQGKTVIVVNDGPGFYTTRILAPMLGEAFALLLEGVDASVVDSSLKKFGFPVGPLTLADEVGIDVGHHIAHYLAGVFKSRMGNDDLRPLEDLVNAGHLGRKSGKGFYSYDNTKKKGGKKVLHDTARLIIAKYIKEGQPGKSMSVEDVQMRMIGRFVNEAVFCLEDGILLNAVDGDMGAVFGLGFPPFLGGPFRFIDSYGALNFVRKMEEFSSKYGSHFMPAKTIINQARQGTKFY